MADPRAHTRALSSTSPSGSSPSAGSTPSPCGPWVRRRGSATSRRPSTTSIPGMGLLDAIIAARSGPVDARRAELVARAQGATPPSGPADPGHPARPAAGRDHRGRRGQRVLSALPGAGPRRAVRARGLARHRHHPRLGPSRAPPDPCPARGSPPRRRRAPPGVVRDGQRAPARGAQAPSPRRRVATRGARPDRPGTGGDAGRSAPMPDRAVVSSSRIVVSRCPSDRNHTGNGGRTLADTGPTAIPVESRCPRRSPR